MAHLLPAPVPASKKRRFFASESGDEDEDDRGPGPPPPGGPAHPAAPAGPGARPTAKTGPSAVIAFKREQFEAFVGGSVADDVFEAIRRRCGNDLERAVNMYYDGAHKKKPLLSGKKAAAAATTTAPPTATATTPRPDRPFERPRAEGPRRRIAQACYVGSFGAEGWATCSGRGLLKHGDVVRLERQQTRQKRAGGAAPRPDMIVRFSTSDRADIGRLVKHTASWVAPLMDQGVCEFDGTVVYAPEELRTNETVFLQVRASLRPGVFTGRCGLGLGDGAAAAGPFDTAETMEERDLRLRQVALVRLLQEVNLEPTSASAAAAVRESRQGLLRAAELAAVKPTLPAPAPASSSPSDPAAAAAAEDPTAAADEGDGRILDQAQLDALYKKAQSFDFATPEAEPAESFALTLRPYQKQALHWMMAKERNEQTARERSLHPLWEEYAWPTHDADDRDLPPVPGQDRCFYVNPYSGDLALDFPTQEQHCLGGILADEMGLGKTIQMLSLMHTHRPEPAAAAAAAPALKRARWMLPQSSFSAAGSGSAAVPAPASAHRTTLVIAPMSLLSQWQSEAGRASRAGTLRTLMYYGVDKAADLRAVLSGSEPPDLVITSYGVVLSEFGQVAVARGGGDRRAGGGGGGGHRGLFSVVFFRLILDEAHTIRNRSAKTARACHELAARHRWLLTGTPIVNKLEDLFSLVRFLRVEPWDNFSFWRTFITVPFESGDLVRALDVVQSVLEPLVLRRTKEMRTPNGELLVPLPPKHVEIVSVELSEKERDVYDYIFHQAKIEFARNIAAGTVLKAFTSILARILRLRQSCCHPILVRKQVAAAAAPAADKNDDEVAAGGEDGEAAADALAGDDVDLDALIRAFATDAAEEEQAQERGFEAQVLHQIRDETPAECPICTDDPMVEQTVTGCWHSTCKRCVLDYIRHETERHRSARCVVCRAPISSRDLFEVIREDDDHDDDEHDDGNDAGAGRAKISLRRVGTGPSTSSKIATLIDHLRALRREHPAMKSVVFSQFTSFLSLIGPALTRARVRHLRLDGTMAQRARAAVLDQFRDRHGFTVLLVSLRAGGVGLNLTSAGRVYMMDPWWSFAVEAQAIDRVHRMGQTAEVRVVRFVVKGSVEERMLRVQERKKFIATSLGMMSDEEKKLQRIEDIRELLS